MGLGFWWFLVWVFWVFLVRVKGFGFWGVSG